MRLKSKYPGMTLWVSKEIGKLIGLIREGRLFAVQDWIRGGGRVSSGRGDTSPLREAVGTGFHSMVEVLLAAGVPQDDKNDALYLAVFEKRLPIVQLLVEHGASIASVDFTDVCDTEEMAIVDYFIQRGASLIDGNPIERSLIKRKRAGLQILRWFPERRGELQEQLDWALRRAVVSGNQDWVGELLEAGADPRAALPERDDGYDQTALRSAIGFTHEGFERFNVDPARDNLVELLAKACFYGNIEWTRYLLGIGADPSATSNDCSMLGWAFDGACPRTSWNPPSMDCVEALISAGTRWLNPSPKEQKYARRALCSVPATKAADLIASMCEAGSIDRQTFQALTCTPKMKAHFLPERIRLTRCKDSLR